LRGETIEGGKHATCSPTLKGIRRGEKQTDANLLGRVVGKRSPERKSYGKGGGPEKKSAYLLGTVLMSLIRDKNLRGRRGKTVFWGVGATKSGPIEKEMGGAENPSKERTG